MYWYSHLTTIIGHLQIEIYFISVQITYNFPFLVQLGHYWDLKKLCFVGITYKFYFRIIRETLKEGTESDRVQNHCPNQTLMHIHKKTM